MFQNLMSKIAPWNSKKNSKKKVTVGICAMDKKAHSKPMKAILDRLNKTELFDIVVFGDECILQKPIASWPVVEVLIAFYSTNYPTDKALEYVNLRKPFLVNDLKMEEVLKDRRKVYKILESQGIDLPTHVFLERDDTSQPQVLEEFDDYILVNGVQINKPFVEKPVDAEDHNIYIYYPMSAGGGTKKLFRKINNKSSEFYPELNEVRREGSFIYEEFVVTHGTDVKVYTVGPEYGHAEARKSPVVDGRVKRDSEGLEVRYPVILSPAEKLIAKKIVTAFRQTVCGFDILRVKGKSYCCDVNGFSFVKNSRKYYDDCANILSDLMWAACRGALKPASSAVYPAVELTNSTLRSLGGIPDRSPTEDNESEVSTFSKLRPQTPKPTEELRCVIAVVRHGDRTPKQKLKIKVNNQQFLDYFNFYVSSPRKDLKVKSKNGLLKFLSVARDVLVLGDIDTDLRRKLTHIVDVLERWKISGINRKLQMKPQKWAPAPFIGTEAASPDSASSDAGSELVTELLVILKWGGDLTPLGREQAIHLGEHFRHHFYPDKEGGGVLRLHSTYRHDLKIKASDEGRVMKTAAAFAKGLLELEGQLTPILASLVTVEEKNRLLLDRNGNIEVIDDMEACKDHMNLLQQDVEMTDELISQLAPSATEKLRESLRKLGNPLKCLKDLHEMLGSHCSQLKEILELSEAEEAREKQEEELKRLAKVSEGEDGSSVDSLPQQTDGARLDAGSGTNKLSVLPPACGASVDNMSSLESGTPHTHGDGTPPRQSRSATTAGDEVMIDLGLSTPAKDKKTRIPKRTVVISAVPNLSCCTNASSQASLDEGSGRPISGIASISSIAPSTISNADAGDASLELPADVECDGYHHGGFYLEESIGLMVDRWEKLYKDFYDKKKGKFDLTKVPDVYDMIRYDALHNSTILDALGVTGTRELHALSNVLENCIVPQEYGIGGENKRYIGSKMCRSLLEKIRYDLNSAAKQGEATAEGDVHYMLDHSHAEDMQINSLERRVRTRLYFTSESHLHTLLNVLRFSGGETVEVRGPTQACGSEPCSYPYVDDDADDCSESIGIASGKNTRSNSAAAAQGVGSEADWEAPSTVELPCMVCPEGLRRIGTVRELSYLTQIVFRLFENVSGDFTKPQFRVEISMSPGATHDPWANPDISLAPYMTLNRSISYNLVDASLDAAIELSHKNDGVVTGDVAVAAALNLSSFAEADTGKAADTEGDKVESGVAKALSTDCGEDKVSTFDTPNKAGTSRTLSAETASRGKSGGAGGKITPSHLTPNGSPMVNSSSSKSVSAAAFVLKDEPTATSDEWERQDAQMQKLPSQAPKGLAKRMSSVKMSNSGSSSQHN